MNNVSFVGRLVGHVEVKELEADLRVVNNTIAINRYQLDRNGEEITDFIPFVAWNRHADLLKRFCQKGDQVAISGRMQSRSYTNKDEQKVYIVECVVSDVTLFKPRKTKAKGKAKVEKIPVTMAQAGFEPAEQAVVESYVQTVKEANE